MDTDVLVERVLVLEGFPALVTAQLLGHHLVDQPKRWQLIAENSVLFYTTVNNYKIIVIGLKLTSENILNNTNKV
jgi:bacterioferritin (cytochrome b1)